MKPRDESTPLTRRHRRAFAALRVVQMTLVSLGFLCFLLIFSVPTTPGSLNREIAWLALSTPRLMAAVGATLLLAAAVLQLIAIPLKRRWSADLHGWIK